MYINAGDAGMLNLVPTNIEEKNHKMKSKKLEQIKTHLSLRPEFDGYVFIPSGTGIKSGEFIREICLTDPYQYPNINQLIYFKGSTQKFYKIIRNN